MGKSLYTETNKTHQIGTHMVKSLMSRGRGRVSILETGTGTAVAIFWRSKKALEELSGGGTLGQEARQALQHLSGQIGQLTMASAPRAGA